MFTYGIISSKVATLLKGAVALVGRGAKSFEVTGLMALGVDELFSNPGYWLEAAVLVVFFVIVNMFPCIHYSTDDNESESRTYLPTPVQAFTDSLGREVTNLECCVRKWCLACHQLEDRCQCPSWNQNLVPLPEKPDDSEDDCDDDDVTDQENAAEPAPVNVPKVQIQSCPSSETNVAHLPGCVKVNAHWRTSPRSRGRSTNRRAKCPCVKVKCKISKDVVNN